MQAPGDTGIVMEVFTLPSADIVFKVIRDRFAYPKDMARKDVMEKYELVFKHDRAGRLIDAQEFKRLRLPIKRFDPELTQNLLRSCGGNCRIEDRHIVLEHCYIERRLTPLNLYLETADGDAARAAAMDYGQAIRELAMSNIFAGDLLLKNFGVTRHGRVIFYDYDELCLLTDCNFRRLPEPRDDLDEMRAGAWFYVGPNDVFPEQFIEFLRFSGTGQNRLSGVPQRSSASRLLDAAATPPGSRRNHRRPALHHAELDRASRQHAGPRPDSAGDKERIAVGT